MLVGSCFWRRFTRAFILSRIGVTNGIIGSMSDDMKANRGQYFTMNTRVLEVMGTLLSMGSMNHVLEPSAGSGYLMRCADKVGAHEVDGIEIDASVSPLDDVDASRITTGSFFSVDIPKGHYDAIIANPPYVALKNVPLSDRDGLDAFMTKYSGKVNLYMLFMDRIIDVLADDGSCVLITPKEWMYSTSARPLREDMLRKGEFTHIVDCGEERLFDDADVPTLMITRWVKHPSADGRHEVMYASSLADAGNGTWEHREIRAYGSHWMMGSVDDMERYRGFVPLSTYWVPRVGMVSGADDIYRVSPGDADATSLMGSQFVHRYLTTAGIEYFIDTTDAADFPDMDDAVKNRLLAHHDALISRRIRRFNESDWFRWGAVRGREYMMDASLDRFFCYGRTRLSSPFVSDTGVHRYSGGMFGIYGKEHRPEWMSADWMVKYLNSPCARRSFVMMGITVGSKTSFQPSTLNDIPIPGHDVMADALMDIS